MITSPPDYSKDPLNPDTKRFSSVWRAWFDSIYDDSLTTPTDVLTDSDIGVTVQAYDTDLAVIAGLADPNADRILFWDDSAGSYAYLTAGTGLSISGTTLNNTVTTISITANRAAVSDGAGVIIASATTDTEIGYVSGVTSAIQTQLNNKAALVHTHGQSDITNLVSDLSGKQPLDATLTALAGVTTAADKLIYATGSDTFSTTDFTSAGRTLAGAADASAQRTSLGLVIGTDVQAYDAELAAVAGLTSAADKGIQFTGSGTAGTYDLTTAGKNLLDDADASAQRTTLGLGTIATQDANNVTISGGSVTGITDITVADGGTGASDASGARTNLGLVIGTHVQAYDAELAALAGTTSAADKVPYYTGSGTASTTDFTSTARNLLDDTSTSAMRTTLGLAIGTDVQAYSQDLTALTLTSNIFKNLLLCGDSDCAPWQWTTNKTGIDPTTGVTGIQGPDMYWMAGSGTAARFTASRATDAPTFAQAGILSTTCYSWAVTTQDASIASSDVCYIYTSIPQSQASRLNGQSITLSFWVKTTITGIYCVQFDWGTGTQQWIAEYTVNAADTWEKKTITITTNSTNIAGQSEAAKGLTVKWVLCAGSTFQSTSGSWLNSSDTLVATSNQVNAVSSTSNVFKLQFIQLEAGGTASTFEYRSRAIERTLVLPYLEGTRATAFRRRYNGSQIAASTVSASVIFVVSKVATPTVTVFNDALTSGSMNWISTAGVSTSRTTTAGNITQAGCDVSQTAALEYIASGNVLVDARLI